MAEVTNEAANNEAAATDGAPPAAELAERAADHVRRAEEARAEAWWRRETEADPLPGLVGRPLRRPEAGTTVPPTVPESTGAA